MHTVHNARVTLLANLLNTVAVAFIVTGFVAPAVTGQLQVAGRVLVILGWAALGVVLHVAAQLVLGILRQ